MVDDYSFGLGVTDRFMPQTLERGPQSTDCKHSNYGSQSSFQDQENKGRPDALNASAAPGAAGKEVQICPWRQSLLGEDAKTGTHSTFPKVRKAGEHWE